jgi:hypothetical protein
MILEDHGVDGCRAGKAVSKRESDVFDECTSIGTFLGQLRRGTSE